MAIVNALRAQGHEVCLAGPAPLSASKTSTHRSWLSRIKQRLPQFVFELAALAYNVPVFCKLLWVVWRFDPDFIYERYALFNVAGVAVARWRRIRLILEVNTPYAQAWSQYYGLTFRRLAKIVEQRTLLAAGHIITVTETEKQMLVREGVPAERIAVSHNAVWPEEFDPARYSGETLRQRLGLRKIVVGFVGTMNRWQGIDRFADVVRQVLAERDDVSFLFVGEGEFRARLEEFCCDTKLLDRVVFAGRQPHHEIPQFIAAMDIAVLLNSNAYGSPMKVFEYLAMQKAVIAPSVGPVLEVLQNGMTGLLIPQGDAHAMAERILELAADAPLRERLGKTGRAYVVSTHTWLNNAASILDIYTRLARQTE
ncbi:MAG: glycosyltransferase family 4 protein [Gammaproteobacteria bacterium]|nr:glycosyltransferase family 4 protein [Gammaproteobacteria bacterium]